MKKKRLSMRKIQEVLRLHYEKGLSQNAIAGACHIARSTTQDYLKRFQAAGLSWPLPDDLGEPELNDLLFRRLPDSTDKSQPDWACIHKELSRKSVTLKLLWQEFQQVHPESHGYTRFCQLYRQWAQSHKISMRQRHKAGEKTFVDWAGQTMPLTDPVTGEVSQAQIFVAALGFSSYLYAEATPSQEKKYWLSCHVKAFRFYRGLTDIVVPDNPKTAVTSPCRYEPELNPAYQEFARHYCLAVIPARVRKPQDKPKVESGVQVVERWVIAPLRNRIFFSLAELNQALWEQLQLVNNRPLSGLNQSRRELFELIDQPALRPLPPTDYEFAHILKTRVKPDYHIELEQHFYSVPYRLVNKVVELRHTAAILEVYYQGQRVASHLRRHQPGQTTIPEHLSPAHRWMLEWTPAKLKQWSSDLGPATGEMIQKILDQPRHPEQNHRSGLGFLQLERKYGQLRLEKACVRALHFNLYTYKQVRTILQSGQDFLPLPGAASEISKCHTHINIRGSRCYR
ncbi:MAG: IS21 family transposase [Desulfotomaculaceae bacterium]|nr:IS21 family transposase [Desulfotomaculaceae bacterium]